MSRTTPFFPLNEVKALALAGEPIITSSRAIREARELGFSLELMFEVIAWLTPDEYDRSLRYQDTQQVWDVYIVPGRLAPSRRKLYIKLRIPSPSMVHQLAITSFHDEDVFREKEDSSFDGN